MRLTLLLICLFSILGGCAASSSHGVVVPKLIRYSEKQYSCRQVSSEQTKQNAVISTDETAGYSSADDDIEEDDERENISLKKYYTDANDAFAFAQLASLSRFLSFGFEDVSVPSDASRKYISLCIFRV